MTKRLASVECSGCGMPLLDDRTSIGVCETCVEAGDTRERAYGVEPGTRALREDVERFTRDLPRGYA